jgi:hypothetical protein
MNRRLLALTIAGMTVAIVGLTLALVVVAGDEGDVLTADEARKFEYAPNSTTTRVRLVPAVTGQHKAEAVAVLRKAGFEVVSDSLPRHLVGIKAPAGTVLRQDPPAGSPAESGSKVGLLVSASR